MTANPTREDSKLIPDNYHTLVARRILIRTISRKGEKKEMSTTMVASEVKAVPPVVSSILDIPLEKIRESKTNPRTQFDQSKLAELAENIRQHGVLQPILVRSAASVFHWTVSVVDVVSIAVPPKRVVAVVVYGPAQALLGMKNGNETDFEVPGCIVNRGVVNMTVL